MSEGMIVFEKPTAEYPAVAWRNGKMLAKTETVLSIVDEETGEEELHEL